MAAIEIKLDFSKFSEGIRAKFEVLKNKDYLLRPVAIELIPLMTRRIHQNGMASDGSQIGQYSLPYLALRQSKYNRTADRKVIIALTSQLENDWSVIATDTGYGIGFLNSHNFDKSQWVEATYNKKIFALSDDEKAFANERFQELIKNALGS